MFHSSFLTNCLARLSPEEASGNAGSPRQNNQFKCKVKLPTIDPYREDQPFLR